MLKGKRPIREPFSRRMELVKIVVIFCLALLPLSLSAWYLRKARERLRQRLIAARYASQAIAFTQSPRRPPLAIGDTTCRFNARSVYIRCAINPEGPCEGCRYYEALE
jgi:Family of unknown function (DUF6464)